APAVRAARSVQRAGVKRTGRDPPKREPAGHGDRNVSVRAEQPGAELLGPVVPPAVGPAGGRQAARVLPPAVHGRQIETTLDRRRRVRDETVIAQAAVAAAESPAVSGAARVDPARVRGTRSQHAERMAAGDAHGLRLRRIPLVVPPYAVPDDAEVGPAPAVRRPVRRDSARVTVAGDRIAIRAAADHGDGAGAVRPAPIAELT